MAPDGPYDDGTRDGQPERSPHGGESGAGTGAARTERSLEPRSRAEYYEALRAADEDIGHAGEHSVWDAIEAENRPALDVLQLTPERLTHILDGDATGGGHRAGIGRPGKTEFPASWDDEKITKVLLDVARQPDQTPGYQEWNGRWVARGTRDDVEVVVVMARDGRIWSGWPLPGGAGVVKNPEGT